MHDSLPSKHHSPKTRMSEFVQSLRRHLDRTKPIVYCSILAIGIPQIIIREYFPELRPPWPLICYPLMILLLGIILVPPLLSAIRLRKKTQSDQHETVG